MYAVSVPMSHLSVKAAPGWVSNPPDGCAHHLYGDEYTLTTNFHSHWLNTSRNFIHDIKILLAPRWCRWWPHIYRKEQTMWEVDQYQESMPQVPSYANWFCLYWKQTIFVTTHALSSTPSTLSTPEEVKNNLCFTRSLGSIWKDPTVW